jgi:hypothetical protein
MSSIVIGIMGAVVAIGGWTLLLRYYENPLLHPASAASSLSEEKAINDPSNNKIEQSPTPKKSQREIPKSPNIQQHSEGANSPNIAGDHNVVTINPDNPEIAKRLQEIKDAIEAQGESVSRKKLLAKYPLGYVIFDLDYKNEVFAYQSKSILEQYEFDWSVVKYTKYTADQVEIRLPDAKRKDGTALISNAVTGGIKKVGPIGGYGIGDVTVWGEILAIRENGIVFLIGFVAEPSKH